MFPKRKRFPSRATKYGEIKSERPGGLNFASKLEASVYDMLYLQEKTGQIRIEEIQSHVYLTRARIHCIPDFKIFDISINEFVYVEAKGFEAERWGIIKKLWRYYGPARMRVYKGSYQKIYLDEEIIPQLSLVD